MLTWNFFSGFLFRNCKSCVYNCDDLLLSSNSSPRSSHVWFSYIHNFIIIFSRVIKNHFNDLVPVGLLVKMVKRCTGIVEVKGSNPVQIILNLHFFKLSFPNCKRCLYNCDDLLLSYKCWLYCVVIMAERVRTISSCTIYKRNVK